MSEKFYIECSLCHRMIPVFLEKYPTELEQRTFICSWCSDMLRGPDTKSEVA